MKFFNYGDVPDVTFVVGKIMLEDWVEFCEIDYDIIEGVYWDGEGNNACGQTVEVLKGFRDEFKAQGNSLQMVVKLIMNSAYGKLIIKKHDKSHIIKGFEEAVDYIGERYGLFKQNNG